MLDKVKVDVVSCRGGKKRRSIVEIDQKCSRLYDQRCRFSQLNVSIEALSPVPSVTASPFTCDLSRSTWILKGAGVIIAAINAPNIARLQGEPHSAFGV